MADLKRNDPLQPSRELRRTITQVQTVMQTVVPYRQVNKHRKTEKMWDCAHADLTFVMYGP